MKTNAQVWSVASLSLLLVLAACGDEDSAGDISELSAAPEVVKGVGAPCASSKDCPANSKCVDELCLRGCASDSDCRTGYTCDGGVCSPEPTTRGRLRSAGKAPRAHPPSLLCQKLPAWSTLQPSPDSDLISSP